jgi:hypothetical protein
MGQTIGSVHVMCKSTRDGEEPSFPANDFPRRYALAHVAEALAGVAVRFPVKIFESSFRSLTRDGRKFRGDWGAVVKLCRVQWAI